MYLKNDYSEKIIVNKSVFITYLRRVKNEAEYKAFVLEIKKKHYDATHCCSGFYAKNIQRSSDDGEPSGTAGIPILNAIIGENIEECAAIVVRYFGGIKLGAGGLIRTYRKATSYAIKKAPKINEETHPLFQIITDYGKANKITTYIRNNSFDINIDYDLNVTITYCAKNSMKQELENLCQTSLNIDEIGTKVITIDIDDIENSL